MTNDCSLLEWLKALAPIAVLVAAVLAWLTRRSERLKDAYAEWGAAVYAVVEILREEMPTPFTTKGGDWNAEWLTWKNSHASAFAHLRSTRLMLLTREPSHDLRQFVDHASDFDRPVDAAARLKEVDDLLNQVSNGTWLLLDLREIKVPSYPRRPGSV